MKRTSLKTTAEAVLRELPSVLGAYVSEDLEGHPREVHLLVSAGPDAAALARDVHGLLQERLGVPIDQRVISIAQLAHDEEQPQEVAAVRSEPPPAEARPVLAGIESTVSAGRVTVTIRLGWQGVEIRGTGEATDTTPGRTRAAATATLAAAAALAGNGDLMLELDFASVVPALDGDYVLVSVLGLSDRIGRRPLPLVGAHPVERDVERAATLAALKAINRILSLALR
jgi:hypothetical protein